MATELAFLSLSPLLLRMEGRPATFMVTAVKLPDAVGAAKAMVASFSSEARRSNEVFILTRSVLIEWLAPGS